MCSRTHLTDDHCRVLGLRQCGQGVFGGHDKGHPGFAMMGSVSRYWCHRQAWHVFCGVLPCTMQFMLLCIMLLSPIPSTSFSSWLPGLAAQSCRAHNRIPRALAGKPPTCMPYLHLRAPGSPALWRTLHPSPGCLAPAASVVYVCVFCLPLCLLVSLLACMLGDVHRDHVPSPCNHQASAARHMHLLSRIGLHASWPLSL